MTVRAIGQGMPSIKADSITIDKDGSWNSTIAAPIKTYDVIVPINLLHTMREIERWTNSHLKPNLEFGMYLKGTIDKDQQCIFISDEYMIPPQAVSPGAIDFGVTSKDGEFNGVIHRHPGAMHSFSGTDEQYINSNFEFSLLYAAKEIKTGIVNLPTEFGRIRLSANVIVDHPSIDISDLPLENIKEQVYHVPAKATGGKSAYAGYKGKMSGGVYTPPAPPQASGRSVIPFDDKEDDEEMKRQWEEEFGVDIAFPGSDLAEHYLSLQDEVSDEELARAVGGA